MSNRKMTGDEMARLMLSTAAFGSTASQDAERAAKAVQEEAAAIRAAGGTYYANRAAIEETRRRHEAEKAERRAENRSGVNVQLRGPAMAYEVPYQVTELPADERVRLQNSILRPSEVAASINVGKHGAVQTTVGKTGGTAWLDFDER